MAIVLAQFREQVRKTAGAPGDCEIDKNCIDAKITEALKKISRLNPHRVIEQVAFGAGDPNAQFPTDCFGIDYQYSIEADGGLVDGSGLYGGYSNLAGYGYQHGFGAGSLMSTVANQTGVRMLQQVSEMSRQTFPDVAFHERGGYINASPAPTTDTVYHVPLLKAHTLASFPTSLADQLEDLAAGLVYFVRAGKFKILEMSAAGGRQKIKLGNMRKFCVDEGKRLADGVASNYEMTFSDLS